MDTRVHLFSTFGPNVLLQPSIQLAALAAHLRRAAIPRVECMVHSAFAGVAFRAWGADAPETARHVCEFGEYPHALLCLADLQPAVLDSAGVNTAELLRRVNARRAMRSNDAQLSTAHLDALRAGTRAYVDERVLPHVNEGAIHLLGFTTDFSQVLSSAYMARAVMERVPKARVRVVLGGAAANLPGTAGVMAALGIRAWCVLGEGELTLERMSRALALLAEDAGDTEIDEALDATPGTRRLDRLNDSHRAHEQASTLETLPLPDFADYFAELEDLASRRIAPPLNALAFSMPMEGSRGCFAACTFCSNPGSWDGYRKMSGAAVVRRTAQLMERHPFSSVTFVDVVCDTWAGRYADELLAAGTTLPSVMCFRAHHPEEFFTRMVLSGLQHVQVGVEALSPPLLERMAKGTRVIHNLRAHKYLAELRVTQWNNLITRYADSTLEDVAETRRLLELTPHFGPYGLSPLVLRPGSPLHDRALREGHVLRRDWDPGDEPFPPALTLFDDADVQRAPPDEWLPAEVVAAWRAFEEWYDAFSEEHLHDTCEVHELSGERLRVVDTRGGRESVTVLRGDVARVLDACHAGPTAAEVAEALRMPQTSVNAILLDLAERRLVARTESWWIALPLRPRTELVRNFHRSRRAPAATPRLRVVHSDGPEQPFPRARGAAGAGRRADG